ncbi:MAG: right-handed parallel beta-helix repeat-containing protein, partial [Thermoplasmata archaeon]|nr:right-handed parallel beta-helix repeat-containing protein [Thermoplasmata archaeon]
MPQNTLTITDAVLTVNHSIRVENQGTIIIRNSTIQFNCSMSYPNAFNVEIGGTCEIVDGDDNIETPSDGSHITSVNDIPYNFTVNQEASFTLSNSVISKCGRPLDDPTFEEGLVVKSKNAMITGSIIRDGYFGLYLEDAEGATVDNVTITDCYIGLMMFGTNGCTISSSQMNNNTRYGAEITGRHGALTMNSVHMEGNGQANLRMFSVSGFAIEIIKCSFGPGGSVGMVLDDVADTLFLHNAVTGCDEGIRVLDGDVNIVNLTVTDCNIGVDVTGLARISFVDLNLVDTTIDVEDTTETNITSVSECMWNNSIASLTCDVVARAGSTFTIESSRLDFEKSEDVPNGLWSLPGSNLQVYNSTVDSPVTHSLVCHLADGSQVEFFQSTFSHLGASTTNVQRMGMYLAGTGTIKEVTLTDSFVGLVFGRTLINVINLTIQDCLTGMIADGAYGRGGLTINGLEVRDCDVSVRARNNGALFVEDGRFNLGGEGFNITTATVTLKDSWVSDPTTGRKTASLRQTATLNLINTGSSVVFDIGPVANVVNILWYLNLTLKYLSDDSNLSQALVTVEESTGEISDLDVQAGVDGKIQEMELREKMYTPDVIITTPHTITVTKGDLEDSFIITMDRSTDHEFFMDNYPPGLLIQSPENGSLHNIATITFEGEAWDACVTATDGLATLSFRVNDGPWSPIDLPLLTEWTFDAVLDDGFHVVEIQVIDRIGNMNSTFLSVEVDTEPPSLTIISPEDGIYINETEIMVNGKTDPNVTVTINDLIVEVDTMGLFNRTLTLSEGLNMIVIEATNVQGITATKT